MGQNSACRRQVIRRELPEICFALFISVILFDLAVSVALFFHYVTDALHSSLPATADD